MNSFAALLSTLGALCFMSPLAAQNTSVFGVAGGLSFTGGDVDGDETGILDGYFTAPIGDRFAVQFSGLLGRVGGDNARGLGAQLFWQDAAKGRIGLSASHIGVDGQEANRIGLEGSLYFENVTVSTFAGTQFGDITDQTYFGLGATYYATDNLSFYVSGTGYEHTSRVTLGTEWQWQNGMRSFVQGTGGDGRDSIAFGVRIAFGGPLGETLKQNDRSIGIKSPLRDSLSENASSLKAVAARVRAETTARLAAEAEAAATADLKARQSRGELSSLEFCQNLSLLVLSPNSRLSIAVGCRAMFGDNY